MDILNRNKNFIPGKDKVTFSLPDMKSYIYSQRKIENYETLAYYQWKETVDNDGQCYFYTLTYNDNALPKFNGVPCFDYEDHDKFLDVLSHKLLRSYGTKLKYFSTTERGEGKGFRGKGNNPHYHMLFFLTNANNPNYSYKKIRPTDFCAIVKNYWQGTTKEGKNVAQHYKYGIAAPGDNFGLVKSPQAVTYCCKYVCKDAAERSNYDSQVHYIVSKTINETLSSVHIQEEFLLSQVFSRDGLSMKEGLSMIKDCYLRTEINSKDTPSTISYWFIIHSGLYDEFRSYCILECQDKIRERVNEFRRRYCGKVRHSNDFGLSGLSTIKDDMNPRVLFPSKKGYKYRPLPLYYYRKKYCVVDYYMQGDKKIPYYRLNDLGVKYTNFKLDSLIDSKKITTEKALSFVDKLGSGYFYSEQFKSLGMPENKVKYLIGDLNSSIKDNYSVYSVVYKNRSLSGLEDIDRPLDMYNDWCYFNTPVIKEDNSNTYTAYAFLKSFTRYDFTDDGLVHTNSLTYRYHKDFECFLEYFDLLDSIIDYYVMCDSLEKENIARQWRDTRNVINSIKHPEYYGLAV
ncbi:replication initiator protein [Capybara microvirus Cap3_SP_367]|nr:replication initiator protein [Capybara microvirus Cap3_SP_367]